MTADVPPKLVKLSLKAPGGTLWEISLNRRRSVVLCVCGGKGYAAKSEEAAVGVCKFLEDVTADTNGGEVGMTPGSCKIYRRVVAFISLLKNTNRWRFVCLLVGVTEEQQRRHGMTTM